MSKLIVSMVLLLGVLVHSSALTAAEKMDMQSMTPAQNEYHSAMRKMDQGMMAGMMDPDPSKSWIKQMIVHHQGAIDMSDIALKYSKDPKTREEAQKTKNENQKAKAELEQQLSRSN